MADIDRLLLEECAKRDGLISAAALKQLGVSEQSRRTRITDGRLVAVGPGVFAQGGLQITWERQLLAAHLGTGGVISDMAAAAYHRFDRIGQGAVEVTVAYPLVTYTVVRSGTPPPGVRRNRCRPVRSLSGHDA